MNDSGDFFLETIIDINRLSYSLGKHLGQLCLNRLLGLDFGALCVLSVGRQNDASNWIEHYAICKDE